MSTIFTLLGVHTIDIAKLLLFLRIVPRQCEANQKVRVIILLAASIAALVFRFLLAVSEAGVTFLRRQR
jgi:hypothetical protein